jgi:enamine deaminase RidA (YjgF/YER057c/UK114 family)
MTDIEVKAVPGLAGSSIPYAYVVKAGPWIFLTGHEAFDFATGSTAAVAGPPGFPLWGAPRFRREGDLILQRMRAILQEFGADLSNGVRLDQFYPTPDAVDPYHLARRAEFGSYIPPSTSVIMERCFNAGTSISASLMAAAPLPGYEVARIYPKDVPAPVWSGFVPAITCSEFVFIAGQTASTEDGEIDPRVHLPDHKLWAGSRIRLQTEFLIVEKLKPALEAAGSALEHSVKAQVYIQKLEDFPDFMEVWLKHFRDIPCAVTVVPTTAFATIGNLIEINLLALKAGSQRRKTVVEADLPAMASYGPCVRAGEFLFPSGLMAVGRDGHVVGGAVSPAFEGLSHAGHLQADTVLGYMAALCKAAGAKPENVVRAQYFVGEIAGFAGISAAWTTRFGARPHPFVCVEVPKPLPAPGAALIADFWIYAP